MNFGIVESLIWLLLVAAVGFLAGISGFWVLP